VTSTFKERALRVISGAFGGEHHVFSLKWAEDGRSCKFLINSGFSTYDFAGMTQLVVHCHDECVRGEIYNGGPRQLRVILSIRERKSRRPDTGAHPTLEQHVEQIRRGGSYQPLFEQLREGE
jgi:hypothetical protein